MRAAEARGRQGDEGWDMALTRAGALDFARYVICTPSVQAAGASAHSSLEATNTNAKQKQSVSFRQKPG